MTYLMYLYLMNFLKQTLRIVLSVLLGYFVIQYFKIKGFALGVLFYFGIYIVISLIIEMVWNYFNHNSKENQ